jgi:surface polysaccharide O-acyltransferase-like enzyme
MGFWSSAERLARDTSPDRNRVVDLMRVLSILVVVFGHWLMAAVTIDDGQLTPGHLLELADWTHPLTWIFQVMPVFFLMGGYSNALSWRSARRRDEPYGSWLRARMRRLALPVVPLVLLWTVGGWLGLTLGLDWEVLLLASMVALVPTWFLAAYVVIVTLAPLTLIIWERLGWWSIAIGTALAGLCDALDIAGGLVPVGFLNYLFVWGTVHLLGYAWVDGKIPGTARRLALAGVGVLILLALVSWGPYPVAMVGIDTAQITNSYPPRVTLVFLSMFQSGLVLAVEPLLARWMTRERPWTFVVAISSQIMTIYLWHLTAMIIVIGLGLAVGGTGFGIEPLTAAWWLTRPVWFVVLAVMTVVLMFVFGRYERPVKDSRPAPPWWRPVVGVLLVCAGLGLLAAVGIADEEGLNGMILALPLLGVILGGIARMPSTQSKS